MKSSYNTHNYKHIFRYYASLIKSPTIVEIGILDGYSLSALSEGADTHARIFAYDLFNQYPYNSANYNKIVDKFKDDDRVTINNGNFYDPIDIPNQTDILHVDISNTARTYKFCIEKYWNQLSDNGVCIMEGGSSDRDSVDWMLKYNMPPIKPYLDSLQDIDFITFNPWPSLTIFFKNKHKYITI